MPRLDTQSPHEIFEDLMRDCRLPEDRQAIYLRRLSRAVWREIGLAVRLLDHA